MHQTRLTLCLAIAAMACAGSPKTLLAQAQPNTGTARVGVINLKQAYSNLQETIDVQNAMANLQTDLSKLADLDRTLAASPGQTRTDEQIAADDQKHTVSQSQQQVLRLHMARMQARQLVRGYQEIRSTVDALARQRGLEVVLVDNADAIADNESDFAKPDAIANRIFGYCVLYTAPSVDLTSEVIDGVNKAYKPAVRPQPVMLPTTSMRIGSRTYQLEIAADEASREHGLMERDTLAGDHGMIFVFDKPAVQSFWMHHTRFPLDVIFADEQGKVVSIHAMKAYDENSTISAAPAKYAIELRAAETTTNGIKPGDTLVIPATVNVKK